VAHQRLWLLTPAYQQRKTTDDFMNQVLNGNDSAAYKSTSNTLQSLNDYNSFQQKLGGLKDQSAETKTVAYLKKDSSSTIVVGTVSDKSSKRTVLYGVTVISDSGEKPKVDTITLINPDTSTALKPQLLALLNRL
jgi:hypothetical protein